MTYNVFGGTLNLAQSVILATFHIFAVVYSLAEDSI